MGEEHERTGESAIFPAAPGGGSGADPGGEIMATVATIAPTGSEIVDLHSQSATENEPPAPLRQGREQVERRAEQRRCELSMLGGPSAASCAGGWMSMTSTTAPPASILGSVAVVVLGATSSGGSDGADPGGATDGGRPIAPTPGPAPGGAAGGVAAGGGGGGIGLSGFLTLAGLLLLAAPRALRLMRLSCRPYRTAFFVLIPERPG